MSETTRLSAAMTAVIVGVFTLVVGLLLGPWVASWRSDGDPTAAAGDGTWYISQMHPWIVQPEPGQCPICNMDLKPIDPARFAAEIAIDPVVVQNMGVRVERAEQAPAIQIIRAPGAVAWDQRGITDVNLRFGGWVERAHVDAEWQRVAAGDPLLTVYAPELHAAAQDYVLARRRAREPERDDLVAASRRRLELAGLPAAEIERLAEGGAARAEFTITAPRAGVVIEKRVNSGSRVLPQTVAYRIADSARVWVEANVPAHRVDELTTGMPATVTAEDGVERAATVEEIYPEVDRTTREAQVRLVFAEGPQALRPGDWVAVRFQRQVAESALQIPLAAVIGTGERKLVFVALGRGRFEPREIEVGPHSAGDRVVVRSGLRPGELVVTSGQFLLDSETRMREGIAKMMQADLAITPASPAPPPPDSDEPSVTVPAGVRQRLTASLEASFAVHQALFDNRFEEARRELQRMREELRGFLDAGMAADPHLAHRLPAIADLQSALDRPPGSDAQGLRHAYGSLTVPLPAVVRAIGVPEALDAQVTYMRCTMAEDMPAGGVWLQRGEEVRNPFMETMRSCAFEVEALPRAEATRE